MSSFVQCFNSPHPTEIPVVILFTRVASVDFLFPCSNSQEGVEDKSRSLMSCSLKRLSLRRSNSSPHYPFPLLESPSSGGRIITQLLGDYLNYARYTGVANRANRYSEAHKLDVCTHCFIESKVSSEFGLLAGTVVWSTCVWSGQKTPRRKYKMLTKTEFS